MYVYKSTRTIPFSQNLARALEPSLRIPKPGINAFGAVRGRSREEAIGIQLHNMHRCSASGISHMVRLFDLTNAFYCPTHAKMQELYKNSTRTERYVFEQIIENQIAIVSCSDGEVMLSPATGVPPGLSVATTLFNWAYSSPLRTFMNKVEEDIDIMRVFSPVSKTWLNTSLTSFVDDVAVTIATADHKDMPHVCSRVLQSFDEAV